jgi:hypothetical protein
VDHAAAGMHASGPPAAPDMIDFSDNSLIHFGGDTPARPIAVPNQNAEAELLPAHPGRATSLFEEQSNSQGLVSAETSVTEKVPSPYVHITPPAEDIQLVPEEQAAHSRKKVRFDLASTTKPSQTRASTRIREAEINERAPSVISDSGSEDILAPDATARKNANALSRQAKKTAASNKASPINTAKRNGASRRKSVGVLEQSAASANLKEKSTKQAKKTTATKDANPLDVAKDSQSGRRKSADILDQFKEGRFSIESDDEDDTSNNPAPLQVPADEDTEDMVGLAKQALAEARRASLATPAIEPAAGTRRSQRAPKPKDFGDVVEHGWKKGRTRRS